MSGNLPTQHTDTGQYSNMSDFGLMYYNARWYDPALGRFAQADTLIPQPGNPQSWDRYADVENNPLRYTDPSGHMVACDLDVGLGCDGSAGITVKKIIDTGYDDTQLILRGYLEHHPGYIPDLDSDISNDRLLYSQISIAMMQVHAEEPLNVGDWTLQAGFGASLFVGTMLRIEFSLGVDGKGNTGAFVSLGGGLDTSMGANAGIFVTITNAPSLDKVLGPSVQIGGQIGSGAALSAEMEWFKDSCMQQVYTGFSLGGGAQLPYPWPFEFHGTAENTWGSIWERIKR